PAKGRDRNPCGGPGPARRCPAAREKRWPPGPGPRYRPGPDGERPGREAVPMTGTDTTTLWRPTGPVELELVRDSGWRAWPPRLRGQPIFYPVLNEDYAVRIARDWNVRHDGAGFVTRFEVDTAFLSRYPVRQAGGRTILELWVPAEELDEFNAHIVGEIRLVHEFHGPDGPDR